MNDDEQETGRSGAMRDKESEERIAMAKSATYRPVFMYRLGESKIFHNPESIPEGQGWFDSPAKVRPMPQIQPPVSVSALPLAPQLKTETQASDAPRRPGRKPKTEA